MTSRLETKWDDSGRKGSDGEKCFTLKYIIFTSEGVRSIVNFQLPMKSLFTNYSWNIIMGSPQELRVNTYIWLILVADASFMAAAFMMSQHNVF